MTLFSLQTSLTRADCEYLIAELFLTHGAIAEQFSQSPYATNSYVVRCSALNTEFSAHAV